MADPEKLPQINRYPQVLRVLHWSIALLIAFQFAIILLLKQVQSLHFGQVILDVHRQCGVLTLILVATRLGVGFKYRAPKSMEGWPAWQSTAASAVHVGMLIALAAQPVLGILLAWAHGDAVGVLGVAKIPPLITFTSRQGHILGGLHGWMACAMLALLSVHLGAVVFNRVVRKVSVVERMLSAPREDRLVNRIPLTVQLSACCGAILAMILSAGVYATVQYNAFASAREKFEDTEVSVLDDMRAAQLSLKDLATHPAQAGAVAKTVQAFPGRLTNADAKAAAGRSAEALARVVKGDHGSAVLATADSELETAVTSQFMQVFQGRLEIVDIAAKGHDLIVLTLGPTVMLSAILAFLLSRSLLSALARARAAVRRVGLDMELNDPRVIGHGEFAHLMTDILAMRDKVVERRSQTYAFQMEQRAEMEQIARLQYEREAENARAQAALQADIMNQLARGLSSLAKGDLTMRLEQPFPGRYDRLRTDFNEALNRLRATVVQMEAAIQTDAAPDDARVSDGAVDRSVNALRQLIGQFSMVEDKGKAKPKTPRGRRVRAA